MRQYLTALLLMAGVGAWAQVTPQTPTAGETYYIYNVGQQKYLANDGTGQLTLGDAALAVTLTQADAAMQTWTMTTAGGTLSATVAEPTRCDGTGKYAAWQLTESDATQKTYTMGCMMTETNAVSYLYWHKGLLVDELVRFPLVPDYEYDNAQWQFVSKADYESRVITLDETSATLTMPQAAGTYEVRLKRTVSNNLWNSLCLPFAVSMGQMQQAFGADVKVAELTGVDATTLLFTSVTAGNIEAGKPYIFKPTQSLPAEGYYTFSGIGSAGFVGEATAVTHQPVTFTGSLVKTTAPKGAYVLRTNMIWQLVEDMAMKGFRAYFTEDTQAGTITEWQLDGTLQIDATTGAERTEAGDIYSAAGQRVRRNATDATGLQKGVYIMNGKKMIVK